MGLSESIVVSSTFLHISAGPERCSVSSGYFVILYTEQTEMTILVLLFSGPPGPSQASCLQRASATEHPSLRPQGLYLFPAPAAEPITLSWTGRAQGFLNSDDIRIALLPPAKLCIGASEMTRPPILLAFPVAVLSGSLKWGAQFTPLFNTPFLLSGLLLHP